MTVRFSTLWWMWFGKVIFDLACIWCGVFPRHTPEERISEIVILAWFIVAAWIIARWLLPQPSSPSTEGGNG
jgi:hypothetical protein